MTVQMDERLGHGGEFPSIGQPRRGPARAGCALEGRSLIGLWSRSGGSQSSVFASTELGQLGLRRKAELSRSDDCQLDASKRRRTAAPGVGTVRASNSPANTSAPWPDAVRKRLECHRPTAADWPGTASAAWRRCRTSRSQSPLVGGPFRSDTLGLAPPLASECNLEEPDHHLFPSSGRPSAPRKSDPDCRDCWVSCRSGPSTRWRCPQAAPWVPLK